MSDYSEVKSDSTESLDNAEASMMRLETSRIILAMQNLTVKIYSKFQMENMKFCIKIKRKMSLLLHPHSLFIKWHVYLWKMSKTSKLSLSEMILISEEYLILHFWILIQHVQMYLFERLLICSNNNNDHCYGPIP